MKIISLVSIFIIFVFILACEPPVTFTEPQPIGVDNLSKFPKRLQGFYSSQDNNSELAINDFIIQRTYDYDSKLHINQLDSQSKLCGDTLVNTRTIEKSLIRREGDTIITHIHQIDTIFRLNFDNVVREFKGYYFLNTRYDKTNWTVKKMVLSQGELTISSISSTQDIESLKEITQSPQDTVAPYSFSPTKKQFKKFIRNGGFSNEEKFVKVK